MPTTRYLSPSDYDAWYASRRGAWMGAQETQAILRLADIGRNTQVLDAGCGSGWFSRQFAATGAEVTGVDADHAMLAYARSRPGGLRYVQADMRALPFADKSFDVVCAVTSLCFVEDEAVALGEMLRVARRHVVLGLLHSHSLLYRRKHGHGAYAGAHWHTRAAVRALLARRREIASYNIDTLLFWPGDPPVGRWLEAIPLLARCFGGFMAVNIALAPEIR